MTIASEITRISGNIADAYTAAHDKGATLPQVQNSDNLADCIDTITGASVGITREVSAQGVFQMPSTNFTFSLPSNATDVGDRALYQAFYKCSTLQSVDLSSLTTVNGSYAMAAIFQQPTKSSGYGATGAIQSVDLSSLTTVNGTNAMMLAFARNKIQRMDLSSLTTVTGDATMQSAFTECDELSYLDLSSLTTVSGYTSMSGAFYQTAVQTVSFPSLTTVNGYRTMSNLFSKTPLQTLSFPALTSTSFGSNTDQFYNIIGNVTGCTVHFPSNLQSVIGSWSDVLSGFGGTNTTVLFDLPATT